MFFINQMEIYLLYIQDILTYLVSLETSPLEFNCVACFSAGFLCVQFL